MEEKKAMAWEDMILQREEIAEKTDEYLERRLSKAELVKWSEDLLISDIDFEGGSEIMISDIVHELGAMDVKGWELSDDGLRYYRDCLKGKKNYVTSPHPGQTQGPPLQTTPHEFARRSTNALSAKF